MSEQPRLPAILVVEDEDVLLHVLRRMLAGTYRVYTASNLPDAYQQLRAGRVDVVLTDLQLGAGQRGEDLIRRFSGMIPCVAMTGFGDRQLEAKVRKLGAVGYLAKPFSAESLQGAIDAALQVGVGAATDASTPVSVRPTQVGLVLSGGGVRGAYEVGVVRGIVEALGLRAGDPPPFRIFVGTSVGAINAAWMAAHAHRGDLGIDGLASMWENLRYRDLVQIDWRSLVRRRSVRRAPSLLRVGPLADLVTDAFDWHQLHANMASGAARALVMPALNVRTGSSTMFAELAPGVTFEGSRDPRRTTRVTRITPDHVLASAAIPGVFPPRHVEGGYFVDGGLRHNVPIAPAIRVGASHLVVISSLTSERAPDPLRSGPPGAAFLLGKLLNALLLDPLQRDLQILQRFNRLLDVLEQELTSEQMARVQAVLQEMRGLPYRRVEPLVFTPTADIGGLTQRVLQEGLPSLKVPIPHRWLLRRMAASPQPTAEADWATYVLFDGVLARRLVELGRQDALARADDVRRFFGSASGPPHGDT